jgi:hypothetical protein
MLNSRPQLLWAHVATFIVIYCSLLLKFIIFLVFTSLRWVSHFQVILRRLRLHLLILICYDLLWISIWVWCTVLQRKKLSMKIGLFSARLRLIFMIIFNVYISSFIINFKFINTGCIRIRELRSGLSWTPQVLINLSILSW